MLSFFGAGFASCFGGWLRWLIEVVNISSITRFVGTRALENIYHHRNPEHKVGDMGQLLADR